MAKKKPANAGPKAVKAWANLNKRETAVMRDTYADKHVAEFWGRAEGEGRSIRVYIVPVAGYHPPKPRAKGGRCGK